MDEEERELLAIDRAYEDQQLGATEYVPVAWPGEWIAKQNEDECNGEIIPAPTDNDPDPEPICTMYSTDAKDLRLIAAAPDLMALCQRVVNWTSGDPKKQAGENLYVIAREMREKIAEIAGKQ